MLSLTARRAFNLAEAWLLGVISPEAWETKYKRVLELTVETARERRILEATLAPADADGRGEMIIVRSDPKDDVTPRALNFGRA